MAAALYGRESGFDPGGRKRLDNLGWSFLEPREEA